MVFYCPHLQRLHLLRGRLGSKMSMKMTLMKKIQIKAKSHLPVIHGLVPIDSINVMVMLCPLPHRRLKLWTNEKNMSFENIFFMKFQKNLSFEKNIFFLKNKCYPTFSVRTWLPW